MVTVKFTKNFIPGSVLEGLTYDTTVEMTGNIGPKTEIDRANEYVAFLQKHTEKPVKACAGSHYTASNIEVLNG